MAIDTVFKPVVPENDAGWQELTRWKKRDACDLAHSLGPEGVLQWLQDSETINLGGANRARVSLGTLNRLYPNLRDEIIHGLLRRGEIMNIIAPSKSNKSWMAGNLAMCVIGGGNFLDRFQCKKGRVLIVDNELHEELLSFRGREIARAMNCPLIYANSNIDYIPLRGSLCDIHGLEEHFSQIRKREYTVVILDALYKFYPDGFDENSNADMAALYNKLDYYADLLDTAFVVIHHSSKGSQAGRSVVDVGAGGSTQARACDAHLVLREHEDQGVFVIDCANRSFKPIEAVCATFRFPVWRVVKGADPAMLKGLNDNGGGKGKSGKAPKEEPADVKAQRETALEQFLRTAITTPMSLRDIVSGGRDLNIKPWHRERVLELIRDGKLKEVTPSMGNKPATYIAAPPSVEIKSQTISDEVVNNVSENQENHDVPLNDDYDEEYINQEQ